MRNIDKTLFKLRAGCLQYLNNLKNFEDEYSSYNMPIE